MWRILLSHAQLGLHLLSKQAHTSAEVTSLEYSIIPVWHNDETINDAKNNKCLLKQTENCF